MAKDGTRRGGARVGAGRKPKSLAEKVNEGSPAKRMLEPIGLFPDENVELCELDDLPPLKDFMTAEQTNAEPLQTKQIYREVYSYLKSRGVETLVSTQLIEQYVMSVARWIQCEQGISANGFISKHPTTGGSIASPLVTLSQTYMKQITSLWCQIFQIIKENSSGDFQGGSDPMEQLLNL